MVSGKRLKPLPPQYGRSPANLRRAYFDCRHGQLHVRTAFPSGGGFDERMTVVIIHDAGQTSRSLLAVLRDLGEDRSLYAPDLPGHGESDGVGAIAGEAAPVFAAGDTRDLAAAVNAVLDLCTDLRLRNVALVGVGAAAEVATAVAAARDGLAARVVSVAAPDAAELRRLLDGPPST